MTKEQQERYVSAAHGVQTAVAIEIDRGSNASHPKQLRTGLDLRAADHDWLVRLLIAKGVFTSEEYAEAMVEATERERDRYAKQLEASLGCPVNLR